LDISWIERIGRKPKDATEGNISVCYPELLTIITGGGIAHMGDMTSPVGLVLYR
jgi:hypothetical protein